MVALYTEVLAVGKRIVQNLQVVGYVRWLAPTHSIFWYFMPTFFFLFHHLLLCISWQSTLCQPRVHIDEPLYTFMIGRLYATKYKRTSSYRPPYPALECACILFIHSVNAYKRWIKGKSEIDGKHSHEHTAHIHLSVRPLRLQHLSSKATANRKLTPITPRSKTE